jgi:hypothetical protein
MSSLDHICDYMLGIISLMQLMKILVMLAIYN